MHILIYIWFGNIARLSQWGGGGNFLVQTLIKKKIKFSSYIRKFRVEQLQSLLLLNYLLALTAGLQRVDFVKFFHNDNYGTVFLREKKTYMTNGLLIYGEIFAHFLIYKEALPHI
jgi:hypothetical protein